MTMMSRQALVRCGCEGHVHRAYVCRRGRGRGQGEKVVYAAAFSLFPSLPPSSSSLGNKEGRYKRMILLIVTRGI